MAEKIPTLAEVVAEAHKETSYAQSMLSCAKKSSSGIAFFCAAHYGTSDVVFYLEGGVKEVCLVDHDAEQMTALMKIYPTEWSYMVGDAFSIAAKLVETKQKYDLVSCEPWSTQLNEVMIRYFKYFYALAKKTLVVQTPVSFFNEHKIAITPQAISKFLSSTHGFPVEVTCIVRRPDGNPYRVFIQKGKSS